MSARLVLVQRAVSAEELDHLDARATILVLSEAAAAGLTDRHFDRLVQRRSMVIVAAPDAIGRTIAGAGLLADWFALGANGRISLEQPWSAEMATGIGRRLGRTAMKIALVAPLTMSAEEAFGYGLVDALVPAGADPLEWTCGWLGKRSLLALQSAAALIRLRGGHALERAEFARLFAAGAPQEGLGRFLAKEPPRFDEEVETEIV